MKILFVSDSYFPHLNGVYYFVCRIAPLLQEKGHEVAVIAPSESTRSSRKKIDNIDVYGIPSLPVLLYHGVRFPIPFLLASRIRYLLKNFKPDIIHIQDHFMISKSVIKACRETGIQVIGTNHFMPENLTAHFFFRKGRNSLEKMMWSGFSRVYNQLCLVTTPTETAADLIRPKLIVRVVAVSSGIDLEIFNPVREKDQIRVKYALPDKPVLLYVGRLDPEKRLEDVLQAFAIAARKIDFCLVIVGRGASKKALVQLSLDLGISDKVVFTGFVPEEDLPGFYKLSRCFIIASIAELLSLSTLQAMASGLPVIAAKAGALSELVKHNENGFLFEPGDIKSMALHLFDIFSNDELANKLGEKSVALSLKHDIRQTVSAFEKIYQDVHDSKRGHSLYIA